MSVRWLIAFGMCAAACTVALQAHDSPSARSWSWEPITLIVLLGSAAAYGVGYRSLSRRGPRTGVRRWEGMAFAAGLLTIAAALESPLVTLAGRSLSAHMVQHELLMLIAAPLLVIGRPGVVMLWSLRSRGRLAIARLLRIPAVSAAWHVATLPLTVFALHAAVIWVWHLPLLYEAALHAEGVHVIQHVCFLGTAVLFWWGLINGRYGRLAYGVGVFYVFLTAVHTSVLGALMTIAPIPWYATYDALATASGTDALGDQQLAGLIMWIPSSVIFMGVGLALFAAWLGAIQRRVINSEGRVVMVIAAVGLTAATAMHADASDRNGRTETTWAIRLAEPVDGGTADGVQFGITEAAATAKLLGVQLVLTRTQPASDSVAIGVIAQDRADAGSIRGIPHVFTRGTGPRRDDCQFFVGADEPRQAPAMVEWHPSLMRYGAAQLNDRFHQARGRSMTAVEWRGWFAVKLLVDARLRLPDDGNACEAIGRSKFDGHKGAALMFDTHSGRLRQPLYVVEHDATGREVVREIR